MLQNDSNNNYTTTSNNSNNNDKITKNNIIFIQHAKVSDTQKNLYMLECGCTSEIQRKSVY